MTSRATHSKFHCVAGPADDLGGDDRDARGERSDVFPVSAFARSRRIAKLQVRKPKPAIAREH
jgi:hypothetical protein